MGSTPIHSYYSDSYSRQFRHQIGKRYVNLKEQINSGAQYIFFINTSYGDTIKKLKKDTEIFNWLNTEQHKLYESESIILYELKKGYLDNHK